MTHGELWPAHPRPLKDELLSSWIVRVIQANGIKLQTLSRMLFGENLSSMDERHRPNTAAVVGEYLL